ncbi:tRNA lysidine(34) synthetase TilS [Candidatus Saccharibacteria bacterium]|nr:tRNA lysidine(34) synthetase TilS [Candidatus Saccharibacteria bacterium]
MKKILAVSGGVDSMVMMDIFLKKYPKEELAVATFDHGTRESSKDDADFVCRTAEAQKIKFYREKATLGSRASEEVAREKRYEFLRRVAFLERGEIYTAHHLDDLVESVAINFIRGTGMRGLAAINSLGIRRPFIDGELEPSEYGFLAFDKKAILKYAAENSVRFRQDPTNASDKYLRNRVREKTGELSIQTKMEIWELWKKQKKIMAEIDEIVENILPEDLRFLRADFEEMQEKEAMEILRGGLMRAGVSATRPQMKDFLMAIKTYAPGKVFNLPKDKLVKFGRRDFMLKV